MGGTVKASDTSRSRERSIEMMAKRQSSRASCAYSLRCRWYVHRPSAISVTSFTAIRAPSSARCTSPQVSSRGGAPQLLAQSPTGKAVPRAAELTVLAPCRCRPTE
eukprot:scaffold3183_cov381-Prasinococcus_capsulatus_cf.AAC.20